MTRGVSWIALLVTVVVVWTVSTRLNHAQPAAAPAGGTKIAVVDLVRVFNDFEQTKLVNQKMQETRRELGLQADDKMKKINAEKAALDAFTPDSPDWHQRRKRVRQMLYDYQIWEQLKKDWITEDHILWAKKTYQMVTDEIARVAKTKGFQLVITQETIDTNVTDWKVLYQQMLNRKVVYAEPVIDLTNEVLANLNASFDPNSVKLSISE